MTKLIQIYHFFAAKNMVRTADKVGVSQLQAIKLNRCYAAQECDPEFRQLRWLVGAGATEA
jgi:hypothetical protein